jgi:hypothetical protein
MNTRRTSLVGTIILIAVQFVFAQDNNSKNISVEKYGWKSVQMVGAGFIDGIIFHPNEKNLCYCRTDMGGAYRRNPITMRWEPMLDWISYEDRNLMGVESIAVDPSDPNMVYLSCGTYTFSNVPNGAILCSNDRGKTFKRTNVPFKMGGNENGRGNGERMMVDPINGNIIYVGTRHAGLWKSTDRGETFNKVENFPDVSDNPPADIQDEKGIQRWKWQNQGSGIIFVLFDPQKEDENKSCSTIYVGVSLINRVNLFRSTDSGLTWNEVPNQPIKYRPTHAALSSSGMLYITYGNTPGPSRMTDGAVWKLNTKTDEWTEITPDKPDSQNRLFGYAGVSFDAQNPESIIVSSYHRYGIEKGDDIFRSTDGGTTWKKVFGGGGYFDYSLAPYVRTTGIHWLFDIEIDPFDSNHAMFTTGYGGHETFNLTEMDSDKPTKWDVMSSGIEESVALDLLSPPKGAHLISAIGDYGGFVHWDLDKPAPEGNFSNPVFGNTNSLACAENNPDLIVRVGRATDKNPNKNIGYSLDGGKTWQPTKSIPDPESRLGFISVSSDGKTWIWTPDPVFNFMSENRMPKLLPVFFTKDFGATWDTCKEIPNYTRVIADRVNPNRFYAVDLYKSKFYISLNGGTSFTEQLLNLEGCSPKEMQDRGDYRGGQDKLYSTPGIEGDLWIAAFDGLFHSTNSGKTFSRMENVQEIHGFGFGKNAPGVDYPALYLIGVVKGVRGIFRSDNIAKDWIRINDDQHQWGMLFYITGDPKLYGRVYVGTHGRGTFYGDPIKN